MKAALYCTTGLPRVVFHSSYSIFNVNTCFNIRFFVEPAEFIRQTQDMGGSQSKENAASQTYPELKKPWREFNWGEKEELQKRLENFSMNHPEVSNVRILVAGQIGAGKSSFINSINSAFQGEIDCEALADATAGTSCSFTQRFQTFHISHKSGKLPFVFGDIMGLEANSLNGLQVDDVIKTISGHVKESYKFKEGKALTSEDEGYQEKPSVSDQAFCLVYVIAADTVQLAENSLFNKLKLIRQRISDQGIPQVIVMTKVDEACPRVKNDLKKIYYSKKIEEKVQFCSNKVGVPITSIFPVKNYHNEINTNDEVDVLILKALDQIVRSAEKRIQKGPYSL
ncbi:interferon-induced protein 44-like [Misgurnus anguillicaudatus]|uniref:interferon-induced protein 44-like n=1 Tax=Misgurnus anguillicaudatus TaxID=75329 RepID=UPI003CCFB72D